MPPDPDIWAVLTFYALDRPAVRQIEPLGSGGGWSGSRLWRVTDVAGRQFCLRQWSREHPSLDRLRFIHGVLCRVVVALPVVAQPLPTSRGFSYVEHDGCLWELTAWKRGTADYHVHPTEARLRAALQVLARFHCLAETCESRRGLPTTLIDRDRQCRELLRGRLADIERSLLTPLGNEIDDRARRLLTLCRQALERSSLPHALAVPLELPLLPAIRDIHHDHVLFSGDEVTGLIDFGALRIDTPLADVARLVGSLVGDDLAARQVAFNEYNELRPLSSADRQLINLLDESGLVLGGVNWLTWFYVERREMGEVGPIVRRLDEILARLERRAV
jgi:Ser/Thr protein kinase RdoA (MazF antagonist)